MSDIPSMSSLFLPCMEALAGGAKNARECIPYLQKKFELTDEQLGETIPSGYRTRIFDRADWALFHLMKAGLVDRPKRGVYELSSAGQTYLRSGQALDWPALSGLPAYAAWKATQSDRRANNVTPSGMPTQPDGETPEERIAVAWQELDSALVEELLEQVLALTPARFEQLIVELLVAMGYGDGRAEMGRAIGKSGDGGIDGVMNEDRLGLDAVYIQAKRYALENTVGRPALQAFVGSLTGENATKGVFVTTSGFSSQAREYVRLISQRVVLIDGQRLARLMIDHGVGVVAEKTYVLHQIDANFFDEP